MKYGIKTFIILACIFVLVVSGLQAEKYYDNIKFPKLNDPKVPDVQTITLDNGIRLYLLEDHEFPLINAQVRIAAGGYLDPLGKIGLADMVGTVMRTGGTDNISGDDLDERLESIGASVETNMGVTSGSASMNVLTEYLDIGLETLADVLRNPIFDDDKIDQAKTQERSAISRRNDNATQICVREFLKILYGKDSPYGRYNEYATIDAITRDDMMGFHNKYITPENIMIAIWGDFKKDDVLAKIKNYFGDWQQGSGPNPPLPEVKYEYEPGIHYIEKTNINQAIVFTGHIGGLVTDPDYYANIVMNSIFGDVSNSRLYNNVRTKQGLAYTVQAVYTSNISYPGIFYAYCQTKFETVAQAIRSIIDEINGMHTNPATEDEMRKGKESYLNSFVFKFDSMGEILQRMMTYDYFGLPADFVFTEKRMVEQITAEDVQQAAINQMKPEALHIVVVGDSTKFDEQLSIFGDVNNIDISIPTGEAEDEVAVTAEILAKGKELMSKALAACGGIDNIMNIKATSSVSEVKLSTPQGEFSLNSTTTTSLPDKIHNVLITPMGEQIRIQNGDNYWIKQGPAVMDASPEQSAEADEETFRNQILTFQNLENSDYQFVYLEQGELNGVTAEFIQIQKPDGSMKYKLVLDAASYMPIANIYFGQTLTGPGMLTEHFGDYRPVSDVQVPYEIKIESDGTPVATVIIKEFSINPTLDMELFEKPE